MCAVVMQPYSWLVGWLEFNIPWMQPYVKLLLPLVKFPKQSFIQNGTTTCISLSCVNHATNILHVCCMFSVQIVSYYMHCCMFSVQIVSYSINSFCFVVWNCKQTGVVEHAFPVQVHWNTPVLIIQVVGTLLAGHSIVEQCTH